MSTKERILEEALTLFSEQGYDGTGIDEIAAHVGIKGPSIYKHFKSKEEILDMLIDNAEERYDELFGSEVNIGRIPENRRDFIESTMKRISFTIHDPMIQKIRKTLVREQFRNERCAEVTTGHQLLGVQKMYTRIISEMIKKELIIRDDPEMLALELFGPVVLMVARADREPQLADEIMKDIENHLKHFCKIYMKE